MKKYKKEKDDWGQNVIYVSKCDKYEYENPEKAKIRPKNLDFLELCKLI